MWTRGREHPYLNLAYTVISVQHGPSTNFSQMAICTQFNPSTGIHLLGTAAFKYLMLITVNLANGSLL